MKKKEEPYHAKNRVGLFAAAVLLAVALGLAACVPAGSARALPLPTLASLARVPAPSPTPVSVATLPPTRTPSRPTTETALVAATPTLAPTRVTTQLPVASEDPYADLSTEALARRSYGGGLVQIEERLEWQESFARYLISYPSDGLRLYGFMNVPHEGERFPVALVLHGYIPPETYEVTDYTTRYADALAEAGFMVFHPNYRNYPPSEPGPNPFRIGYAVDVLNLIAIIKTQSQDPTGVLRRADSNSIHLLGHSMGGSIALRVALVWPEAVDSLALYGAMSGDEQQNYERIKLWASGRSWQFELAAPEAAMSAISPLNALDRLIAPVSIHHGAADTVVPATWSEELCTRLNERGHPVSCYTYEGQAHTFHGEADALLQERLIAFFRRNQ